MIRHARAGYSLLELLLVLALAGVLSGLAWNSAAQWQSRAQRDRACLALQQLAAREEAWRIWHRVYTAQPEQLGCAASGCVSGAAEAPSYSIAVEVGDARDEAWFTLRAQALGRQRADRCGTLSLDQRGRIAASGGGRCCGVALH